jgi:hypothetical protein
MKNLLLAIVMGALALATPWLAWREFAEVAQFVDRATDGQLSVVAETGDKLSRGGRRKRTYDASIESIRVQIVTSEDLAPDQQYPVVFSPEALRDYSSQAGGIFAAYKLGSKSDSRWGIFARDYGWTYVLELVGLEILWLVMTFVFWRSFTNERSRVKRHRA